MAIMHGDAAVSPLGGVATPEDDVGSCRDDGGGDRREK